MDSVGTELEAWIDQMPAGVDADVEAARQRIGRISRLFEHVLVRAASTHELTVGDAEALSVLHRAGHPYELTPKQLADTLGVTSGTISVRIERLTKAGLVEPVRSGDGRSRPVRLTSQGRTGWRNTTRMRTTTEHQLFADALSATELATLNPLLGKLLARFEAEFGPAPRHDITHHAHRR